MNRCGGPIQAEAGRQQGVNRPQSAPRVRRALLACALAAAPSIPTPAPAQDDVRLEVAVAALAHVRESLPPGKAVLDPGLLCSVRLNRWSCPELVESTAGRLGLQLGSREFSYVCLEGDRDCRLMGAEVLLQLLEPRVLGEGASIGVRVWWRTEDEAQPVGHRRSVLSLQRERSGWRVTGEDPQIPR